MRPDFDIHDAGSVPAVADERLLAEGLPVAGRVMCHHPFGLGVYVEARDQYGHVHVPYIREGTVRGAEDYPSIGAAVEASVLGYSGAQRQLRLSLRAAPDHKRK